MSLPDERRAAGSVVRRRAEAGSKLDKARELGVPVPTDGAFERLIGRG
jgi:hypothetical protein